MVSAPLGLCSDLCLAACKQHILCLLVFFLVNILNWAFTILQMIFFYVAYDLCGTDDPWVSPASPFQSICNNTNDLLFWIPSILLAVINACGAFAACSLRWKVMHTD